jgi:hypothetical protein
MINSIDLRTLRNGEFVQFGADFYGLINANNPSSLNIDPQLPIYKTKLDETANLFKNEKSSPITQDLVLLDERRDKAINGLSGVIEGYCYHFEAATANAATVLVNNLKLYGPGIAKLNFPTESATLDSLTNDWETKPELIAAISQLGLNTWVAELKTANQLFKQKYLERTQEYGAANPETMKAKREETVLAYYELRKFLDANSVLHPSETYTKLINELNSLIDQYNVLLNSRVVAPVTQVQEPVKASV